MKRPKKERPRKREHRRKALDNKSRTKPGVHVEDDGYKLVITLRPQLLGFTTFKGVFGAVSFAFILFFLLYKLRDATITFPLALILVIYIATFILSAATLAHFLSKKQTITATSEGITILNRSLFYNKTSAYPKETISFLALSPFREKALYPGFQGPFWLCLEDGLWFLFGLDLPLEMAAELAGAIKQKTGIIDHKASSPPQEPVRKDLLYAGENKIDVDDDDDKAVITITRKPRISDLALLVTILLIITAVLAAIPIVLIIDGDGLGIILLFPMTLLILFLVISTIKPFIGGEVITAIPGQVTRRMDYFGLRGKTETFHVKDMKVFSPTYYLTSKQGPIWLKINGKTIWLAHSSSLDDGYDIARLIKERAGISDEISWGV